MAEFVQRRKEDLMKEVPGLYSHFKKSTVKNILNQREKYEYRLMRRSKQKTDFTQYITFLKSVIKKIEKIGPQNDESLKLISLHNNRIGALYHSALKYFKDDVSLWKEYIKFLIQSKRSRMLSTVIDKALLLHGHISDDLYVFALKKEIGDLKNIRKAREMYTVGLRVHKNSSPLYLEAFKGELAFSENLAQKMLKTGKEFNTNDPALNGSIAKVIFESAVENIKNDYSLFLKMYHKASACNFALNLSQEIKSYMLATFSTDPNYWDTLAKKELLNKSVITEQMRIKNCLDIYDEALSIIDTDEMWDKYLTNILQISSDTDNTTIYKRNLLRQSMINAHSKKKMKPMHYIQWVNKSSNSMVNDVLDMAVKAYPNDTSILELKINKLIETDKLSAYKLFEQNSKKVSPSIWLTIVEYFSNEPQIKDIFDMVFEDNSVCTNEVKQKLGNEYISWLNVHKSLNDTRNAYNKLMINNCCDASVCKTLVSIEIKQEKIDIAKIRQHFTLACMKFGKTDIDLWMDRIYFEIKYGSPKFVSSTYHQALTTLNNEESDQFAEEYALKASKFNTL